MKPDRQEFRLWINADESITLFADEVSITPAGDVVFQTFIEAPIRAPNGEVQYEKKIALIQAHGTYHRVETMHVGHPLWKSSGKVSTIAAA